MEPFGSIWDHPPLFLGRFIPFFGPSTVDLFPRIHGPTLKSSRPETSTVELRDPHSLDAELPEEVEDAAEPKMEKSKSLKERLEELSSNSHWDFSWFLCKMVFFWMF